MTLDFDGSVIGTGKWAEGPAVGFNRKKKGQRSYYPLFCTVAQTGQVLDVVHRSGNVHDSHGAKDFILRCIAFRCIAVVRAALPGVSIEVRMDSAFFSDEIVGSLDAAGGEYTVSIPFERFTDLKARIEARRFWWRGQHSGTTLRVKWKPKACRTPHRFLFIRNRVKQQHKDPIQLDLFVPHDSATLEKRTASGPSNAWTTFRRRIIQRAGRLIRPQGQLTFSASANPVCPPIRRSRRR